MADKITTVAFLRRELKDIEDLLKLAKNFKLSGYIKVYTWKRNYIKQLIAKA